MTPPPVLVAPPKPKVGLNMLFICRALPELQKKAQGSSQDKIITKYMNTILVTLCFRTELLRISFMKKKRDKHLT